MLWLEEVGRSFSRVSLSARTHLLVLGLQGLMIQGFRA